MKKREKQQREETTIFTKIQSKCLFLVIHS